MATKYFELEIDDEALQKLDVDVHEALCKTVHEQDWESVNNLTPIVTNINEVNDPNVVFAKMADAGWEIMKPHLFNLINQVGGVDDVQTYLQNKVKALMAEVDWL